MAKQYKPGQLITVDHKIYRVKKSDNDNTGCYNCAFIKFPMYKDPCRSICIVEHKLPNNCYLGFVKSCGNQDS